MAGGNVDGIVTVVVAAIVVVGGCVVIDSEVVSSVGIFVNTSAGACGGSIVVGFSF